MTVELPQALTGETAAARALLGKDKMSIKIILLLIFVGLAGYALGRLSGGRGGGGGGEPMLRTSAPRTLDAHSLDEIKRLVREQHLIAAIKIYRERTDCGLREAKEAVESIARNL